MTTITSIALRVFPGRSRSAWALTWRTERSGRFTDKRLAWGYLPVGREELSVDGYPGLLRRVAADMERSGHVAATGEAGPGAPGGGGGRPTGGLGLPGIDPDE